MSNSEKEDIASKSDKQNKKKESPKEVITIQKDENSKSEYPFRKKSSKSEQKGEVVKHPRQMIPDSPF
jgi:hypothetical protein